MRLWLPVLVIGILALGSGGFLLFRQHHTHGVAGVGTGIVLLLVGGILGFYDKSKGIRTGPVTPKPKTGFLKKGTVMALISILVIVAVGVGTFYGVTLLSSQEAPGTSSTKGAGSTSQSVTGSRTTTSTSEHTEPASTYTETLSTVTSVSATSTASIQSSSAVSSSSTSTPTGGSTFTLVGSPSVIVEGNDATLNATYVNAGNLTLQVNLHVEIYLTSGIRQASGNLFYPTGPSVSPGATLMAQKSMGTFPNGRYMATFYVIDNSLGIQLSPSTTVVFDVQVP